MGLSMTEGEFAQVASSSASCRTADLDGAELSERLVQNERPDITGMTARNAAMSGRRHKTISSPAEKRRSPCVVIGTTPTCLEWALPALRRVALPIAQFMLGAS